MPVYLGFGVGEAHERVEIKREEVLVVV